ncbi:MAG: lasso peptide biosynthesis B2 protein [Gemmatimonadetes bacterium]|nr:lasso peptide biosynthesis B2 protein [Gemmatimonadota bacterium]
MNWHKLSALSLGDTLLLAESAAFIMLVRIGLRFLPHRSLQRLNHDHVVSAPPVYARDRGAPGRIAWALGALAPRLPGKNTCLIQALAAHAMLRRRGYPSELRIGVSGKDPAGAIKAHAWVECEGRVVVGDLEDLTAYSVLTAPKPS